MKLGWKKSQKGFTLVELMVVMAIMAVLAAIVFPAVSGTSEVAGNSQVKQDAGTVNTAVSDYYADQTGAEMFSTNTTSILGTSSIKQEINSLYPEKYLTVTYLKEFPVAAATTNMTGVTASVSIKDADGTTVTAKELAEKRNAIDLDALVSGNYIAKPKSAGDKSGDFYTYLWLVEKTTASSGGGASVQSRQVEVFKLVKAVKNETTNNYDLYYEQVY